MIIEMGVLIGCGYKLFKLYSNKDNSSNSNNTIHTVDNKFTMTESYSDRELSSLSDKIKKNQQKLYNDMSADHSLDPAAPIWKEKREEMFKKDIENDPEVIQLRQELYVNMRRNKEGIKLSTMEKE